MELLLDEQGEDKIEAIEKVNSDLRRITIMPDMAPVN